MCLDADQRDRVRVRVGHCDYFSRLLNLIHSDSGSAKGYREHRVGLGIQIKGEKGKTG